MLKNLALFPLPGKVGNTLLGLSSYPKTKIPLLKRVFNQDETMEHVHYARQLK
jgi:hypothetical protein